MHTKIYDVIIVGAGPAGLHAAKLLSLKGYEILVLESKDEIGKNVICTGIIGKKSYEELGFAKNQVLRSIQNVRMDSPFDTSILYRHPEPFAFVLDRQRFDKYLMESALGHGVRVVLQCRVINAKIEETNVKVKCIGNDGSVIKYKCKTLVIATGVENGLNMKLGLGYPVHFSKAAQKYLKSDKNDEITLIIGNRFAKGGFGWIVPLGDGMARIGLISKSNLKSGFKNIMQRYFPFEQDNSMQIKPIAQGLVSKTFSNRVIAIGEAAGQVKTTTGGGIYFGLLCAEIATNVLDKAFKENDFSEKSLSNYQAQWKSKIGNEIRLGSIARNICSRLNDSQIEKIFNAVQSNGYFDYIARNADFDRHGVFILNLLKKLSGFNNVF